MALTEAQFSVGGRCRRNPREAGELRTEFGGPSLACKASPFRLVVPPQIPCSEELRRVPSRDRLRLPGSRAEGFSRDGGLAPGQEEHRRVSPAAADRLVPPGRGAWRGWQ